MPRKHSWLRKFSRRYKDRQGVVPWLLAFPQLAIFRLLRFLPETVVYGLSAWIGKLALLSSRRRAIGRAHIEQAIPKLSPGRVDFILRQSCAHLGRSGADAMVLWPRRDLSKMNARCEFEDGALELLDQYRGRGVIFIQAHLGAIEMTTTAIANFGFKPATVMRRPSNWYLAEELLAVRNRIDGEVLPREGALKRMLSRLKNEESVVLTFDQNARNKPIFVPWFGRLAATERTPAALAAKTGAPVMLSWCVRQDGIKPFRFGCRLVRAGLVERADEKRLAAITTEFHRALEEVILEHPEQYLWIHDRYRTRPLQNIIAP